MASNDPAREGELAARRDNSPRLYKIEIVLKSLDATIEAAKDLDVGSRNQAVESLTKFHESLWFARSDLIEIRKLLSKGDTQPMQQ
jgi:hypothetical protein